MTPQQSPVKDLLAQHNLTDEECKKIVEILGREPNLTELGMFSVMWSEHCSYKSSRIHLKKLPTTGPRVVQGPGENAGAVDIGCEHLCPGPCQRLDACGADAGGRAGHDGNLAA